jgi:hypothetical protein
MKIKTFTPYAAVLALALLLSACSSDSAASPTAASETAPIVVDTGTTAATEEATPTEYWSVPLSETYRVDSYEWSHDKDTYSRNEMVSSGWAFIRNTFNDMFIVKTNIGYLEDLTTEASPFTIVKEVGEDGGAEFGYYLAVIPRTDMGSHLSDEGILQYSIAEFEEEDDDSDDYHTESEYEDLYDFMYTVRLVDIYDNVINDDWDVTYGLYITEDNLYLGGSRVQYLSWHTSGDVPVENIAYVEFNFIGITNYEHDTGRPILDYYIKVRNPYVSS